MLLFFLGLVATTLAVSLVKTDCIPNLMLNRLRSLRHKARPEQSASGTDSQSPVPTADMGPTIHFVRHAQGFHNISVANHSMRDPQLTPYGKEQCAHLAKTFPHAADIDLIVASPIKRTIATALYSFGEVIDSKKLTIIALPEVQETSDLPCDTGSSRAEIEREFPGVRLDLSLVTDDWNSKQGKWAPAPDALEERCRVARNWLRERPEKNIVVVTHGGVLHYLTEDWTAFDKFAGTGWVNTEFRSYVFDASSGNNASLVETQESLTRRRGSEKPLSEAEQRNLERSAELGREKENMTRSKGLYRAQHSMNMLQNNGREFVGAFGV